MECGPCGPLGGFIFFIFENNPVFFWTWDFFPVTIQMSQPYCKTWDFTYFITGDESYNPLELWDVLSLNSSKWCFQLERGASTGRLHIQGRIRLRKKVRMPALKDQFKTVLEGAHWSPTQTDNSKAFNYVMKLDTKVKGPWTDQERPCPPPQYVLEMDRCGLFPWQKSLVDICNKQKDFKTADRRSINVLIDEQGGAGKSSIALYCNWYKIAKYIVQDNAKEMMGAAIEKESHAYIIDLPRTVGGEKSLVKLYRGIEQLKNGFYTDPRYKHREVQRDMPCLWVFTNELPNTKYLTQDRWKYWRIKDNELEEIPRGAYKRKEPMVTETSTVVASCRGIAFTEESQELSENEFNELINDIS